MEAAIPQMTIPALKAQCRAWNLKLGGKKADLLERLTGHLQAHPECAEETPAQVEDKVPDPGKGKRSTTSATKATFSANTTGDAVAATAQDVSEKDASRTGTGSSKSASKRTTAKAAAAHKTAFKTPVKTPKRPQDVTDAQDMDQDGKRTRVASQSPQGVCLASALTRLSRSIAPDQSIQGQGQGQGQDQGHGQGLPAIGHFRNTPPVSVSTPTPRMRFPAPPPPAVLQQARSSQSASILPEPPLLSLEDSLLLRHHQQQHQDGPFQVLNTPLLQPASVQRGNTTCSTDTGTEHAPEDCYDSEPPYLRLQPFPDPDTFSPAAFLQDSWPAGMMVDPFTGPPEWPIPEELVLPVPLSSRKPVFQPLVPQPVEPRVQVSMFASSYNPIEAHVFHRQQTEEASMQQEAMTIVTPSPPSQEKTHWAALLLQRLPALESTDGQRSLLQTQDTASQAYNLALRFWIRQLYERVLSNIPAALERFLLADAHRLCQPTACLLDTGGCFSRVETADGSIHTVLTSTGELIPAHHPLTHLALATAGTPTDNFLARHVRFQTDDDEQGTAFHLGIHQAVYEAGEASFTPARRFLIAQRMPLPRVAEILQQGTETPCYLCEYQCQVLHVDLGVRLRQGLCCITTTDGDSFYVLTDTGDLIGDVELGVPEIWQVLLACDAQGQPKEGTPLFTPGDVVCAGPEATETGNTSAGQTLAQEMWAFCEASEMEGTVQGVC